MNEGVGREEGHRIVAVEDTHEAGGDLFPTALGGETPTNESLQWQAVDSRCFLTVPHCTALHCTHCEPAVHGPTVAMITRWLGLFNVSLTSEGIVKRFFHHSPAVVARQAACGGSRWWDGLHPRIWHRRPERRWDDEGRDGMIIRA